MGYWDYYRNPFPKHQTVFTEGDDFATEHCTTTLLDPRPLEPGEP